jgi:hypothetical protein
VARLPQDPPQGREPCRVRDISERSAGQRITNFAVTASQPGEAVSLGCGSLVPVLRRGLAAPAPDDVTSAIRAANHRSVTRRAAVRLRGDLLDSPS